MLGICEVAGRTKQEHQIDAVYSTPLLGRSV